MRAFPRHISSALLLVSLLAACATPPLQKLPPVTGTAATPQPASLAQQAAKAYRAGRFELAAQQYRKLADAATDVESMLGWRLRSAETFALAGLGAQSADQLLLIRRHSLSPERKAYVAVIHARQAMAARQPQKALRLLPRDATGLSATMRARIGIVKADAYQARGWSEDSVLTRMRIDPLLRFPGDRSLNHRRIWRTLLAMPTRQINAPPPNLAPVAAGWWRLAAIVRNYASAEAWQRNNLLNQWAGQYPRHPAREVIFARLAKLPSRPSSTTRYVPGATTRIALLLPLSGRLESVGRSVQNGFAQAARADSIQYQIYDTGGSPHRVPDLYRQAIVSGADLIVGPLTKEGVSAIASLGELRVPVLTLNTLAPGHWAPEKVFQFGLNPEAEAEQVARQAIFDGRFRAAILRADKDLDTRLADSFARTFEGLGGEIVDTRSYPPRSNNLSAIVKGLLRPESARPLWKDVRGGNRTRGDQQIDMIFITGSPRDARLIRPMLRFHHAVDLPAYSTSQVYSQPDPFMDRDLDGLVFCDMPAVLGGASSGGDVLPVSGPAPSSNVRLASLGADAFLLAKQLSQLATGRAGEIQGRTGRLSVSIDKRVSRGLECAVFRQGRPRLLAAESN